MTWQSRWQTWLQQAQRREFFAAFGLLVVMCAVIVGYRVWGTDDELEPELADATVSEGVMEGEVPPSDTEVPYRNTLQLGAALGYSDAGKALAEASVLAERVSGGFLPSAWKERCKSGEYSEILCQGAEDYFGVRLKTPNSTPQPPRRRVHMAVSPKNAKRLQSEDFQGLLNAVPNMSFRSLTKLAEAALNESACPRNLSLALGREVEQHLGKESDAMALLTRLDDHGAECLTPQDPISEFAFLRVALLRYATGNADLAASLLEKALAADVKREESRLLYWRWRVNHELGRKEIADQTLQVLGEKFPLSWHNIIAQNGSHRDPIELFRRKTFFKETQESGDPAFDKRFAWLQLMIQTQAAPHSLLRYGEFVEDSLNRDTPPGLIHHFARFANDSGLHRLQILSLAYLLQNHPERFNMRSMELFFPRPYFDDIAKGANEGNLDLALVLALARQESSFNPGAVSRANARGLLQVLPSTARTVVRRADLAHHGQNIDVGTRFLTRLMKQFDGFTEKVVASYNAGPGVVRKWQDRYAFAKPTPEDPQLFVDLIPYRETRDYVSSVLRNAYWYHRLYPDFDAGMTAETRTSEVLRRLIAKDPPRPASEGAAISMPPAEVSSDPAPSPGP